MISKLGLRWWLPVLVTCGLAWVVYQMTGPAPPAPANLDSLDPQVARLIRQKIRRVNSRRRSANRRITLGMAYEANEFHDLASRAYQQTLEASPDRGEIWFRNAICQERQGDLDQAIDSMEHAIELEPEFAAARWRQSMWLLDTGNIDKAEVRAAEAARLDPDDPSVWFAQARVLLARRQNEAARELIEEKQLTSTPNGAYANFLIGTAYRQAGTLKKALPYLEKQHFRPTWRDDWSRQLVQYHTGDSRILAVASGFVRKGKYAKAIPMLVDIANRNPSNLRVLNMLGTCYLQAEQWDASAETFRKALAVNDQHFASNLNYSAALIEGHRHGSVDLHEALRHADVAISLRPNSAKAHAARAMIYDSMGQKEKAIESLAKAHELDSRDPIRAIQAARLELDMGHDERAVRRLEAVIKQSPDHASVFIELANIQNGQARFAQALESYEQALKAKNCSDRQVQFVRGKINQLREFGVEPANP